MLFFESFIQSFASQAKRGSNYYCLPWNGPYNTKDMPEAIRNLGNDSDVYALNVLLEYFKKSVDRSLAQHCHAKDNITINAAYAYVGGLFGLCTTGISDSTADVDIDVTTTGK